MKQPTLSEGNGRLREVPENIGAGEALCFKNFVSFFAAKTMIYIDLAILCWTLCWTFYWTLFGPNQPCHSHLQPALLSVST
jgi:hypothetical protein